MMFYILTPIYSLMTNWNLGIPAEPVYEAQLGQGKQRWSMPPIMKDLKERAKELGLWNMFLPNHYSEQAGGFTNLEYGLMAEYLGKSQSIASEATNCAAPDTGNMELLAKFGSREQKERWLQPLLDGEIRSSYVMTEPDVASSDATNVSLSMTRKDGGWVLNGRVSGRALLKYRWRLTNDAQKHWISGAVSDRCK
jgi:acyl-CoA dehydrogenase